MKSNFNVKVFATYAHWASQPNTVHYKDSHFYVRMCVCVCVCVKSGKASVISFEYMPK